MDTDPDKLRREPRVDISLPVVLQLPDGELNYAIDNASYRGVFIACPEPLPLRKLVRFQTRLTVSDEPLQMLGLVAHTVNAVEARESGKTPGMGLQLFGVGSETRDRWREFITDAYERDPEARDHVRELEAATITVHMRSMEQLLTFAERDLEEGNIFVRTSELSPPDSMVLCEITHPEGHESFSLEARVIEVKEAPRRERGMRVEFSELDEEQREAFLAFVHRE
ncbi:MAG: PilZ domain-containing protein [Persicimonas sp.]